MLIAPKQLKLWISNLTGMFPATARMSHLEIFFGKGVWPWSHDHQNFLITWQRYALSQVPSSC